MTRKEYAEQVREKSIEQSIAYGYTREQAERAFDWITENAYRRNYRKKDEFSATIRHGNQCLYGCGMHDEIIEGDIAKPKTE